MGMMPAILCYAPPTIEFLGPTMPPSGANPVFKPDTWYRERLAQS